MAGEEWIIVPNWDKFQHYSDRAPIWIKLYLELRDKDEWRHLTYAQRGCLVTIWMEFGATRGALRVSYLAQKSGHRTRRQHIDSLLRAGFIQLSASKPLALARSREKKERREEKSGASARKEKTQTKTAKAARNWIQNGATADVPLERLGDVIADEFKLTDPSLIGDLVTQALEVRNDG